MTTGVYQILNSATGKCYIGSAVDMRMRIGVHKHELRYGKHHSGKLQNAWNKYGREAFSFTPLLICDKKHLAFYEQRAIDGFDSCKSGYNMLPLARTSFGYKLRPETREALRRPRGICVALLGHSVSEETRKKIGDANRGRVRSVETRRKMSEAQMGNTNTLGFRHSEESKRKMSVTRKGFKHSPEAIEKIRLANVGNHHTEETKAKLRAALYMRLAAKRAKQEVK